MKVCVSVAELSRSRRSKSFLDFSGDYRGELRSRYGDRIGPAPVSQYIFCLSRVIILASLFSVAGLNLQSGKEARADIRDPAPEAEIVQLRGMTARIPLAWIEIETKGNNAGETEESANKTGSITWDNGGGNENAKVAAPDLEAQYREAALRMGAAWHATDMQARERETAERRDADPRSLIRTTSSSKSLKRLKPAVLKLLVRVQTHFGKPLHIVSGCRSKSHNRRIGGAGRSQHLHCNAVDFQIPGVSKAKLSVFIKRMRGRGGVGTYCRSSYVHLDAGPRRDWHWPCRKPKKSQQVASKPSGKKAAPKSPTAKKTAVKIQAPPTLHINDLINQ